MSGGKRALLAILLACLMATTFLYSIVLVPKEASAYTPHAPINIGGNGDFTAANGVTGGSGTPSDPYIIEGWEIDATNAAGLVISSTDAHFIIRDVYVHSGNANTNHGIRLNNVVNGRVENASSIDNWYGLLISRSDNITVEYGNYSNGNWFGIYVLGSGNFTINHVNARANDYWGIHLHSSNYGVLINNTMDGNWNDGASLFSSSNITLTGNNVFGNNDFGFRVRNSADLRFEGNSISSNVMDGINLEDTTNVSIISNTINSDGVVIWGYLLPHYNSHTMTPDNMVNGEPLLYYKDTGGIVLDGTSVGQLLFANCTDVEATNLVIVDTDLGIEVAFTTNATITSNTLSNNRAGISIDFSSNVAVVGNNVSSNDKSGIEGVSSFNITVEGNNASNVPMWGVGFDGSANITISGNQMTNTRLGIPMVSCPNLTIAGNNISSSTEFGIGLQNSDNALIYHNNIINNPIQAVDTLGSENLWDDGYPSGGNYWSDYGGLDQFNGPNQNLPGSDGIGDTPYIIDGDSQDRYPLMEPYSVLPTSPSEARDLSAVAGVQEVTLTWNTPASDGGLPITNYRIYRGTTPGGEVFLTEVGNVLTYPDTGLTNGQIYCYRVSAVNGVGEGGLSNEACATPTTAPGASTILQATLSGKNKENVTITWSLSADDGTGQNSVVSYAILRNTTYDANGTLYAFIDSVPNGTTEYTDSLSGEGNPNNHFYRVCAVDLNNLTNCSQNQGAKYTRTLSHGTNLASIPLIQSNESIEAVLQTVKFDKAWAYDSSSERWKSYMTFKPYEGDLETINHTMGIWLNATTDCNLTVAGLVPQTTSIHLHTGWNLIGFPSLAATYTAGDLKAAVVAQRIEGFDALSPPYFLKPLMDGDVLQTVFGYWINTPSEATWIVTNS